LLRRSAGHSREPFAVRMQARARAQRDLCAGRSVGDPAFEQLAGSVPLRYRPIRIDRWEPEGGNVHHQDDSIGPGGPTGSPGSWQSYVRDRSLLRAERRFRGLSLLRGRTREGKDRGQWYGVSEEELPPRPAFDSES